MNIDIKFCKKKGCGQALLPGATHCDYCSTDQRDPHGKRPATSSLSPPERHRNPPSRAGPSAEVGYAAPAAPVPVPADGKANPFSLPRLMSASFKPPPPLDHNISFNYSTAPKPQGSSSKSKQPQQQQKQPSPPPPPPPQQMWDPARGVYVPVKPNTGPAAVPPSQSSTSDSIVIPVTSSMSAMSLTATAGGPVPQTSYPGNYEPASVRTASPSVPPPSRSASPAVGKGGGGGKGRSSKSPSPGVGGSGGKKEKGGDKGGGGKKN
ncbi:hypothetical protein QBC41DRAFT_301544 [Cercophora samala]|uniref:Uncharacterized protein n=1 Tax=Cercophora samala TaxID=330535 RepID=A0AA40DBI4_9PEZI|nr:hypothetical protein QBC41DRAFT_301544 [Cercophora samala]